MVWYWTWHTLQVSTPLTPYIACFWRARSPWSTRIIWSPMRAQPSWAGNLVPFCRSWKVFLSLGTGMMDQITYYHMTGEETSGIIQLWLVGYRPNPKGMMYHYRTGWVSMGIPDSHGIIPKAKQFRLLNTPFQNQSTINSINIQIHLFKISLVVVWPYFMPDQQGYALLRSFPELDVAGVLPCSNLERLKGDWFCWMGHPQKDNDQSNLWPFHDDSPLEFWNLFPNFISDKGTLIYIYMYVYVYVYMSMSIIYIYIYTHDIQGLQVCGQACQ